LKFITIDIAIDLLKVIVANSKVGMYLSSVYRESYCYIIEQVKSFCDDEELVVSLYEIFKEQFNFIEEYKKIRKKKEDQVLNDPILVFGVYNNPKIRMSEFIKPITSSKELVVSCIRVFLLMRQSFGLVNDTETVEDLGNFPFKEEEADIEVPKVYYLTTNNQVINCQEFENDLIVDKFILEDEKMFVLLKVDYENLERPKVEVAVEIRNVSARIDFTNPKKLLITITNSQGTEERSLYFENHTSSFQAKNLLEKCSKKAIQEQMTIIKRFLDACKP